MFVASSMVSGNGIFFVSGTSKYRVQARSNRPDVIRHGCKTLPDSPEEHIVNIYYMLFFHHGLVGYWAIF